MLRIENLEIRRVRVDHDEASEAQQITTSEVTCDKKKCEKKHARGVSGQARDINKIHTWHCCREHGRLRARLSITFTRLTCRVRCARACMVHGLHTT